MNRVDLVGYLTRDPELRYTQSNQAVCTFTLAVNKRLSREKKEELEAQNRPTADFPRIYVWGKMGENASRYLFKGSPCAIEGRLQTGSYQDRESGKTIYTTDVIADNVTYLPNSSQNDTQQARNNNSNVNTSRGQQNQSRGNYRRNNDNGFYEDDFSEIEDGNAIPF